MTQIRASTLQVTYMTRVPLKLAYLTDQDGTIISYKDGGWDSVAGPSRSVTFTWDASRQPLGLVPHIVYEDSCADVFPSEAIHTWVRQAPPLAPTHSPQGRPPAHSAAASSANHGGQRE